MISSLSNHSQHLEISKEAWLFQYQMRKHEPQHVAEDPSSSQA
jgi:hypothetical protein